MKIKQVSEDFFLVILSLPESNVMMIFIYFEMFQNEEVQTGKKVWHKFAKGILLSMSVGGISFSAVHTRNLYDSKQKCKAYWNQQLK